jgi:acetyl-CoA carboxylase carboxyltransferase component
MTEPDDAAPPAEPASLAELRRRAARATQGGSPAARAAHDAAGKRFARDRVAALLDPGSFVENGLLARTMEEGLAADGVVTGMGTVGGRPVCIVANDFTVKAGTWGRQTIRKIYRQQEEAERSRCPIVYLVDSAGARLDEQFDLFVDRQHAGRIFLTQCRMSGRIPQICVLLGSSPAGAAYMPAFCDAVIMVEGHASAYLGSPRMVEMATREVVTSEDMGGARMHCEVSGLGDHLAADEEAALVAVRRYLEYLPQHWEAAVPAVPPRAPRPGPPLSSVGPEEHNTPFDVRPVLDGLFDEGSVFQHRQRFAPELITCFARLEGGAVGVLANQPMRKGGVLTGDSSDKGAHFVQMCNAYGLPLLFLCDVPGFMVGTAVERAGIIRHGAKFLQALADCSVPRICVVLRKAYGAGYLAMSGASFGADATIALPQARLAIMGPEAAVNAIHFKTIAAIADPDERAAFVAGRREEYMADLDVFRAASEVYLDAVVSADDLRTELALRLRHYTGREPTVPRRRTAVVRG